MKTPFAFICLVLTLLLTQPLWAQTNRLKPGFDKAEFIEMLRVAAGHVDSLTIELSQQCKKVYRSTTLGLDNKWELWQRQDGVAVISIRGTTLDPLGWVENFHAAMLPATGELALNEQQTFVYRLAKNPQAAVHAGWLIGTAYLANDILAKMDSCIQQGTKEFIITGDSQGGAIAFLMTSYLYSQVGHRLPVDLRFKTYCIAAPKPGNLSYAYDYELTTQSGWAYNVVNSADWVPEFPLSVQTTDDFNLTNPFNTLKQAIKKQPFFNRVALGYVFKKLDKPSRLAQRRYQKLLGGYMGRQVRKTLPSYQPPGYFPSAYFVRAGQTIVLNADEVYYQAFPADPRQLFKNHLLKPYLFLANQLK